jgi:hypothetical protein
MKKEGSKLTRRVIFEKEGHSPEALLEMLEKAIEVSENTMSNFPPGMDHNEFLKAAENVSKEVDELGRKYRMIKPYKLTPIDGINDIMSLEEFIQCCNDGGFIDYDGYGRYMEDGMETDITIYPSDVKHNSIRTEFKEIIWFNR